MRTKIVSVIFLCGILLMNPIRDFASAPFDSVSLLASYEDSMKSIQFTRITAWTDKEKDTANARLFDLMHKALLVPGSFDYPFDSLTTIGICTSPDNRFRIITWDVPKSGCNFGYYGFIQSYNARKKKYDLFILENHTADIPNSQTETCTPNKWIGMLYYKIIKEKDCKFYTLLAWQGYNKLITDKVIDVLTFNAEGIPCFGKPVFLKLPKPYRGRPKRMIFEYSAQLAMSLRYDQSRNMIMFDHLAPAEEGLEGQYQYYGPSFQVDALQWKNGTWSYEANVEARNPNERDDQMFNDPHHPSYQLNKKAIYTPSH